MRSQYQLQGGRPNPYAARLGAKGRQAMLEWWSDATSNLRALPPDLARAFPDTKSTVEALRLVVKLQALAAANTDAQPPRRRSRRARSP